MYEARSGPQPAGLPSRYTEKLDNLNHVTYYENPPSPKLRTRSRSRSPQVIGRVAVQYRARSPFEPPREIISAYA